MNLNKATGEISPPGPSFSLQPGVGYAPRNWPLGRILDEFDVAVHEQYVATAGHVRERLKPCLRLVLYYRNRALGLGTPSRVVDVGDHEPLDPFPEPVECTAPTISDWTLSDWNRATA